MSLFRCNKFFSCPRKHNTGVRRHCGGVGEEPATPASLAGEGAPRGSMSISFRLNLFPSCSHVACAHPPPHLRSGHGLLTWLAAGARFQEQSLHGGIVRDQAVEQGDVARLQIHVGCVSALFVSSRTIFLRQMFRYFKLSCDHLDGVCFHVCQISSQTTFESVGSWCFWLPGDET